MKIMKEASAESEKGKENVAEGTETKCTDKAKEMNCDK